MSSSASSSGAILVRITQGGKTKRYISFVESQLSAEGRVVVVHAVGRACVKAITVAEVVKTLVPGLHQITDVGLANDADDPAGKSDDLSSGDAGSSTGSDEEDCEEEGRAEGEDTSESMDAEGEQALGRARVAITLSTGPLDARHVGYQPPSPGQ